MGDSRPRAGKKRASRARADATAEATELGFETALERLEGIVEELEQGDLELERALAVFEEGVGLTRRCAERLDETERRIEVLVAEGGTLVERPLEVEEEA